MSKTIKQIADEIGVSKQAVQKRIAREPLYTSLYPYISTKKGTKYIVEAGETLIKQAFQEKTATTQNSDVADNVHTQVADSVYTILQRELDSKNQIIEQQQQSIRELTSALENTTASLQAAQALHAGTLQQQQLRLEENNKKKRWQFWKKDL